MALKGQVEQERVACSNLRCELQIEQSRSLLLEKRLNDSQKEQEDERQRSAHQQDVNMQEKTRLQRLLTEAESRLTEVHSKLADAHKKLDEERDRWSRQMDELSRRHEADAARDRNFVSDMRAQLEQERKQGEELAAVVDRLRAEFLQSRRNWEEEDRKRREELQREQEAATLNRIALETLKEQEQEAIRALEVEQVQYRRQGLELTELKERLRLMKDKEREREEQWEREKRKGRQEQLEKERRQERTNNKLVRFNQPSSYTSGTVTHFRFVFWMHLKQFWIHKNMTRYEHFLLQCELELLRQQDQQRMQELQRTLEELEREERAMTAQRLSGPTTQQQKAATSSQPPQTDGAQTGSTQQNQQVHKLFLLYLW